jgi:hypothetical protein
MIAGIKILFLYVEQLFILTNDIANLHHKKFTRAFLTVKYLLLGK